MTGARKGRGTEGAHSLPHQPRTQWTVLVLSRSNCRLRTSRGRRPDAFRAAAEHEVGGSNPSAHIVETILCAVDRAHAVYTQENHPLLPPQGRATSSRVSATVFSVTSVPRATFWLVCDYACPISLMRADVNAEQLLPPPHRVGLLRSLIHRHQHLQHVVISAERHRSPVVPHPWRQRLPL